MAILGRVRRRRLVVVAALLLVYLLCSRDRPPAEAPARQERPRPQVPPPPAAYGVSIPRPDENDETPRQTRPVAHPPTDTEAMPAEAPEGPEGPEEGAGPAISRPDAPTPEAVQAALDAQNELDAHDDAPPVVDEADVPAGARVVAVGSQRYIDPGSLPMVAMAYGTTARPPIAGLTNIVAELHVELAVAGDTAVAGDAGDGMEGTSPAGGGGGALRRRRVVFVGDVHGQRASLEALLAKIGFEADQDHLVLVGDLVNKGPDSAGVVALAMALGASAVRGNHEDRVLAAYRAMHPDTDLDLDTQDATASTTPSPAAIAAEGRRERARAVLARSAARLVEKQKKKQKKKQSQGLLARLGIHRPRPTTDDADDDADDEADHARALADLAAADALEPNPFAHGDGALARTAATLSPAQAAWLAALPVFLDMGSIAPAPAATSPAALEHNRAAPFNRVVVVHAGLVPGVPLARQDPCAAMVMRSLVHPADEVRRDRARLSAELQMRAQARGRLRADQHVDVPPKKVEAAFRRLQAAAYGSKSHPHRPHHPHRPRVPGSSVDDTSDTSDTSDRVMVPIEGHVRQGPDRVHWAAAWNQAQHADPDPANRTTVVYGHDALTGLLVPPPPPTGLWRWFGAAADSADSADTGYTFGLDSGAVYGGPLTALIVEADHDGRVTHRLEQVPCPAFAKKTFA